MSITDQPSIPPDNVADQVLEVLDDCQRTLAAAIDNARACLRSLGVPTVPAPGPDQLQACKIQRGQQLIHDDGWWHVAYVERCGLDSVLLTLRRVGQTVPVVLDVDPSETFTVAEPF